jgi:hypothetical protein
MRAIRRVKMHFQLQLATYLYRLRIATGNGDSSMRARNKWFFGVGLAAKLGLAVILVGQGGLGAAPRAGYGAVLATPLPAPRHEIVGGLLWKCAGGQCAAPADGSRPVLVCQRVAKAFGAVTRFTGPAGELSGEDLSRCNAQV